MHGSAHQHHALTDWAQRLRATAAPALPREVLDPPASPAARLAFAQTFRDDAGHARDVDAPLLAHMLGLGEIPVRDGQCTPVDGASILSRAWQVVAQAGFLGAATDARTACDARACLPADTLFCTPSSNPSNSPSCSLIAPALAALGVDLHATGPLCPRLRESSIETWTEHELGLLHALAWLALLPGCELLAARLRSSALWMLDELQPDNATNHPWGVGVFAALSLNALPHAAPLTDREASDANLYAQNLVHNCLVARGMPDRFSALLLWDSAAYLDSLARVNSLA